MFAAPSPTATVPCMSGSRKPRAGIRTVRAAAYPAAAEETSGRARRQGPESLCSPAAPAATSGTTNTNTRGKGPRRDRQTELPGPRPRHVGAVLAAQSGATTAELMHRPATPTPQMALRYQHVADNRGRTIAERFVGAGRGEPA